MEITADKKVQTITWSCFCNCVAESGRVAALCVDICSCRKLSKGLCTNLHETLCISTGSKSQQERLGVRPGYALAIEKSKLMFFRNFWKLEKRGW